MEGLYDRHLAAFVAAVERGSFSKAAQALFISPNALIKQVDLLERQVGVRLLDRTPRGVRPTPAGEELLRGARGIIAASQETLRRTRAAAGRAARAVRLASSVLRPSAPIGKAWGSVETDHPGIRLEITQISDEPEGWNSVFGRLGQAVDVVGAILPSSSWPWYGACQVLPLYREPIIALAPRGHHLAGKGPVRPDALADETIMIARKDAAPDFDALRTWMVQNVAGIRLKDVQPYDLAGSNACIENGWLGMVPASWHAIHPSLVPLKVEWDFRLTQCLLCPKEPRPEVQEFADAVAGWFREHAKRER